jgi:hypothetical protein
MEEQDLETYEDASIALLEQIAENTAKIAASLETLVEGIAELSERVGTMIE